MRWRRVLVVVAVTASSLFHAAPVNASHSNNIPSPVEKTVIATARYGNLLGAERLAFKTYAHVVGAVLVAVSGPVAGEPPPEVPGPAQPYVSVTGRAGPRWTWRSTRVPVAHPVQLAPPWDPRCRAAARVPVGVDRPEPAVRPLGRWLGRRHRVLGGDHGGGLAGRGVRLLRVT